MVQLEADIGYADHFAAVDIDDLLIEEIALDAQDVLVGVVWIELFVAELDAGERDGCDLVVADGKPGGSGTHKIPVNAGGVNEGDDADVFDPADPALLQVEDGQAEKFGEVEELVRHRLAPSCPAYLPTPERDPRGTNAEKRKHSLAALYIRFGTPELNMPQGWCGRQEN